MNRSCNNGISFRIFILVTILAMLGFFGFQAFHHHHDHKEELECQRCYLLLTVVTVFAAVAHIMDYIITGTPINLLTTQHQYPVLYGLSHLLNKPPPIS